MKHQLLTHSRQDSFKTCRKKHWFSYELGVRSATDAKALRMGSAFHDAVEQLSKGLPLDDACAVVYGRYEDMPEHYEPSDWGYERETVLRLVCGYQWRWGADPIEHIEAELPFEIPLTNPATGKPSRTFKRAGKIDGIIRVTESNRLAVLEHKLLSEDLGSDSPLWKRLRVDHQISGYVSAARTLGYQVDCVYYSVTRKPTVKPEQVPILDELGAKIVLNQFGDRVKTDRGLWRQTGDKERGYVLQTRMMTAEEWGEKLSNDIADRPDFYFARREIQRLDQDIAEFERELWDVQKTLRDAQLNEAWYRTCNKDTCAFCNYFDLCTTGWQPTDVLPENFVRVYDLHPELGRETNVHTPTATCTAPQGTAARSEHPVAAHDKTGLFD